MKPYPFQAEDLDVIDKFKGRVLLAWDPGLGKTAETLWWLGRSKAFPVIIVCPASVKWQWAGEVKRLLGMEPFVAEGIVPKVSLNGSYQVAIINYDILTYWKGLLNKWKPVSVVLDECQYISNQKTKRYQAARELCRNRKHVIGLSATPMLNRPIELFAGLQMIRPDVFRSRWKFIQNHCNPQLTPWGWNYNGASHIKELHELLIRSCMIRRKKTEVFDQFPSKVRNVIVLPLKDRAEYNKVKNSFLKWLEGKDVLKAKKASKAVTLTKVGYLLREAARLKMRFCVEWINRFLTDSEEKLVVFAIHTNAISALQRNCKFKSVIVDGSKSGKSRREAVERFRTDDSVRLFIGNLRAAGVGLDGLQVTRNIAFAELPWQPGLVQQGEDRVWRIGSTRRVWAWYFVAKDTIEEKLCSVLQEKQEILTTILDGGEANNFDVLDKLLEEISKGEFR